MKFRAHLTSALALGLLATSPALARQNERQGEREQQARSQQQQREQQEERRRTQRERQPQDEQRRRQAERRGALSGQVVRTKKVGIRNHPVEHLVVLLRTDKQKLAIADLGPVRQLSGARISSGDRLNASGRVVQVGDRQVLMADLVRKNDRSFRIDRRMRQSGRQVEAAFRGEQRRRGREAGGEGQIVRTKKAGVRGQPVEHLIVLVKSEQGNVRIVDLGPVKNLQNVKIATGDTIAFTGEVVAVGDRQVLMADRLRKDGRETQIDRQSSRRDSRQRSGPEANRRGQEAKPGQEANRSRREYR